MKLLKSAKEVTEKYKINLNDQKKSEQVMQRHHYQDLHM